MPNRRPALLLLPVIYLGFISLGLPDGALGVAWPAMYPELELPLGLAGTITIVITLLSGLSGFASGRLIARFQTGPVVLISGAFTAGALLALAHAPGAFGLFAAAVPLGLGAGAVDAGLNAFVARHYSGKHMNWLHACWGIGATTGPLIMGHAIAMAGSGWRGGYLILGGIQLALAAIFLATLPLWNRAPEPNFAGGAGRLAAPPPELSADSFAGWLSPAIFALYTGVEAALGLWAATILAVGRGFRPEVAALCVAGYYGAITAGRLGVGFIVEQQGNRRLVWLGTCLALVGAVGFAVAATPLLAVIALSLTGLGLAPVYPCLMHEVPRRFAPAAALIVIGRQSGGAYLGVAVLPAVGGWIAQQWLEGVTGLAIAGLVVLLAGIRRLDRMT